MFSNFNSQAKQPQADGLLGMLQSLIAELVQQPSPSVKAKPAPVPQPRLTPQPDFDRVRRAQIFFHDARVVPCPIVMRAIPGFGRLRSGKPAIRFTLAGFGVEVLAVPQYGTNIPMVVYAKNAPLSSFTVAE